MQWHFLRQKFSPGRVRCLANLPPIFAQSKPEYQLIEITGISGLSPLLMALNSHFTEYRLAVYNLFIMPCRR